MNRHKRGIGVALCALLAVNTACYSYVPPAQGIAPHSGEMVRVRFNAEGTNAMAGTLGPGVAAAEGMLNEANPDGSIVVGVSTVLLTIGGSRSWAGMNVVSVPARYVAGIDVKRADRSKTRAAIIGGVLAIAGIFALIIGMGGAHGGPQGDGPTPL
ncbi:MAG: hypothetical protein IT356_05400 [Gemmatimonadaceae bacterium]|nr:hypothetical protein [Gemmatimonadaceae bacterium]